MIAYFVCSLQSPTNSSLIVVMESSSISSLSARWLAAPSESGVSRLGLEPCRLLVCLLWTRYYVVLINHVQIVFCKLGAAVSELFLSFAVLDAGNQFVVRQSIVLLRVERSFKAEVRHVLVGVWAVKLSALDNIVSLLTRGFIFWVELWRIKVRIRTG